MPAIYRAGPMNEPAVQVAELTQYRQEIRKSQFLALAAPTDSPEMALTFIGAQRQSNASHHCWAYRCGAHSRCHDDGEPGGTAGRPILKALETQGFDRTTVLVIRWFGGIKLGPGGLMRAYGSSAAECLRQTKRQPLLDYAHWQFECNARDLALIRARLPALQAEILAENHAGEQAQLTLRAPHTQTIPLTEGLTAITRHPQSLRLLRPGYSAYR